MPHPPPPPRASVPPPPLVALAAWLLPGAGYWLIGQRARGLTVGVTIILVFALGLLIGGVRVIEVPKFDKRGRYVDAPLLQEVRSKPWSIAQVLTGPVAILGGAWGVSAAANAQGTETHGRINEIGVLYTAVAGMLNLLAIIDASHRAGQPEGPDGADESPSSRAPGSAEAA